jgi:hypothetical protein
MVLFFLHYDGNTWTGRQQVPAAAPGIVHNSADDMWSTGSSFVHYDGSSWPNVNAVIPTDGSMGSMTRISSNDMWAVGRYYDGGIYKTLTMHYGSQQLYNFTSGNLTNLSLI